MAIFEAILVVLVIVTQCESEVIERVKTIMEDDEVVFESCTNNPDMDVTWYQGRSVSQDDWIAKFTGPSNNKFQDPLSEVNAKLGLPYGNLTILKPADLKLTWYTCQSGSDITYWKLTIIVQPSTPYIKNAPDNFTVNTTTTTQCVVDKVNPSIVSMEWYMDDKVIGMTKNWHTSANSDGTLSHIGTYSFYAKEDYNQQSLRCQVEFEGDVYKSSELPIHIIPYSVDSDSSSVCASITGPGVGLGIATGMAIIAVINVIIIIYMYRHCKIIKKVNNQDIRELTVAAPLISTETEGKISTETEDTMSNVHSQKLREHSAEIIRIMQPDRLLALLYASKVITQEEKETIEAMEANHKKNSKILDLVSCKPDWAYSKFTEALRNSEQPHIAGLLETPDN